MNYSRCYPIKKKGIDENPIDDEIVLYLEESNRAFSLNRSARAIWEMCDGYVSIHEIALDLSKYAGKMPDEILVDVELAIRELEKQGLIQISETPGNTQSHPLL